MTDDLAALRLQLEWGADEALGEAPLDRFAPAPRRPEPPKPVASPLAPHPHAATLDALADELAAFDGCRLRDTATTSVRPDGNPKARVVLIADAPGRDDDRSGRAFDGAAGALLDRVLAPAGLDRSAMLLTTLVPWRPPGGRPPTEAEVQACLPFVHRLLAIVRPRYLMLVGAASVKALSGRSDSLRRLRGNWLEVQIPGVETVIPTLAFPAMDQWLASSTSRQRLWLDLIALQKAITTT